MNGTATAGATSTVTLEASKTFLLNQWANSQIRIKSGTGAGQIKPISSNTAGASPVITVASAWATVPDATSVYVIEGNDDYMYLAGNNAVTLYRYTISTNTWTTLSPTAARAGAYATGGTLGWIDAVADSTWTDGTYGAHTKLTLFKQNGRYLYSFRGGATSTLDVYDIAANTWISAIAYSNQFETFTTGSCSVDMNGVIYIQKEATGRIYRFDVNLNELTGWTQSAVPQGGAVVGGKMMVQTFTESGSNIYYLYSLANTSNIFTRWLII